MDFEVVWSPEAIEDVDSIADFISRDSAFYASAVVMRLFEASRALTIFPLASRIVPELGDENVRERFVYSYRMIYRVGDGRVLIVAVVHGKRLLEPLTDRFAEPKIGP